MLYSRLAIATTLICVAGSAMAQPAPFAAPTSFADESPFSARASASAPAAGAVPVPIAPVAKPGFQPPQPKVDYVTVPGGSRPGWLLAEVLRDQPIATPFREAVERVGLNQRLDADQGFTAFIPVIQGKNSSDPMTAEALENATKESLSKYIVKERINIAMLRSTGDRYTAIDGSKVRVTKMGDSVMANGVRVLDSVKTPQGFIYYIKGTFPAER